MRRLLCIFLLICLPLQSFAMQLGGIVALVGSGPLHDLEHDHGFAHHHGQDGSIHYDNSDESAEHIEHHCAGTCQFLLTGTPPTGPIGRLQCQAPLPPQSTVSDPDLEDPERPPAFAPGTATGG